MACNLNSPYMKSCARVYNNTAQTVASAATPLTLEGTPVVESGTSITLTPGSFVINNTGLYHFSADVMFTAPATSTAETSSSSSGSGSTASGGGNVTVQMYKDGVALPCAIATNTVSAGGVVTSHIETDLYIPTCCMNTPAITVQVSGLAGTVNRVCAGALKLA